MTGISLVSAKKLKVAIAPALATVLGIGIAAQALSAPPSDRPRQVTPTQSSGQKPIDLRPIQRIDRLPPKTNELKLPVQPDSRSPSRFEGGGAVVPTPTGGFQGGAVVRDNKRDSTHQLEIKQEPKGEQKLKYEGTFPLPGGEPKKQ
jgi:hypothetical protein